MGQTDSAGVENEETIEEKSKLLCRLRRFDVLSICLSLLLLAPLEATLRLHRVDDVVDDHLLHWHCRSLLVLLLLHEVLFCLHIVVTGVVGHRELRNRLVLSDDVMNVLFLAVTSIGAHHILLHLWIHLHLRSLIQLLPSSHVLVG